MACFGKVSRAHRGRKFPPRAPHAVGLALLLQQKDQILRSGLSAPQVGLEPTTLRLTAECSAIELLRNMESGGDLLSRAVTSQVPSALKGLTSVFGMGTGVTPSSLPPEMVSYLPAHLDNCTACRSIQCLTIPIVLKILRVIKPSTY